MARTSVAGAGASGAAAAVHPADERRRDARGLRHHESARRRDLVGERHDRRLELAAVVVGASRAGRRRPAGPRIRSRRSRRPVRQARPNVSVITTPSVDARAASRSARPERARRTRRDPRAAGPASRPPRWRRRRRRSRRRTRGASPRSRGRPRRATTRRVSRVDGLRPVVAGDEAALRLGDDLLRHGDDVAVARRRAARSGRREQRGEVVARTDLGEARERAGPRRSRERQLQRRRARAPRRGRRRVMIVSVTPTRMPAGLDPRREVAVRARRSPSRRGGPSYAAAAPAAVTSRPAAGISWSAIPASGAPPTMPLTPATTARRAATASRIPGTARIGPIDTTGFDGQSTMASALRDRLEHARRRPRRGGALVAHGLHVVGGVPRRTQYSWKCRSSSSPVDGVHGVDARRDPVVGHRQEPRRRRRSARAIRAVTSRQRRAAGEQVRAEQVRREVEVAEVEPRLLGVEGPQLLGRAERLVAPPPAALAVEDVAEPVGDRVGVGGDVQAVHVDVVGRCSRSR